MNLKKILTVLVLTIIFPILFYKVGLGVNLFIYNILILAGLAINQKLKFSNTVNNVIIAGTITSAFAVVIEGTAFSITVNIISLFLLAGVVLIPSIRSIIYSSVISLINFFYAQYSFFSHINELSKQSRITYNILKITKVVIIPVAILIIFVLIYNAANPVFEGLMKSIFDAINQFIIYISKNIDGIVIWLLILGFLFANFFVFGKAIMEIENLEKKSSTKLKKRTLATDSIKGVKTEYNSAIVLFTLLNALLLVINSIDIWWVWFNFSWDGEYLKQFVHEGTYLLILSILMSLALSIFYFRGNINFIKNNQSVKRLAYLWLFQNAILTISVGIRNYWYIEYFSLAYLRIGVIFFLILTLYSIYSVYIKIKDKKSTYFLFSKNSLALYILLIVIALFNWDVIIAKYNFKHAGSSFLHYNFMVRLSDNALPYLDKSKLDLKVIDMAQNENFPFKDQYMTSSTYFDKIQYRKYRYNEEWPQLCWKEWTWAGQRSYNKLNSVGK